jgi:hypothetical protein
MPSLLRAIAARGRDPKAAQRAALMWRVLSGLALCACAFAVLRLTTVSAGLSSLTTMAIAISISLIASAAVASFDELSDLSDQRARDIDAQKIFERLQRNEAPPRYAVYLRPFSSTNQIDTVAVSAMMSGIGGSALGFSVTRFELEQQIERATRPLGPLVCLGEGLEHVGAGRLEVSDEAWREAVLSLCAKAALIVMLPSSRPGTLWEIEHILDTDAVTRTVFIDPPNSVLSDKRRYDQAGEWRAVRDAFAARGFELPADNKVGRLLFFGPDRKPQMTALLDIDAEDNIRKFFRSVIQRQGQAT